MCLLLVQINMLELLEFNQQLATILMQVTIRHDSS